MEPIPARPIPPPAAEKDASARAEARWARHRRWLLAVALLHTVAGHVAFSDMNPDKVMQITAARSLLDRGELTVAIVDPDLTTRWEPLIGWPAGYSVAIAALWKLTGEVWLATVVLDALMAVVWVATWFALLERLRPLVSSATRLRVWLWWALLFGPAMAPLPSSDLAAATALSVALLLLVPRPGEEAVPIHGVALSGVCAIAAAALRYASWVFLALGPLLFAATALASRTRREPVRRLLVASAVSAGGLGLLVAWGRAVTGHATNLTAPAFAAVPGVYWSNLLQFYAFPTAALGIDAPFKALFFKLGWTRAVPWLWTFGLVILWLALDGRPRPLRRGWTAASAQARAVGALVLITSVLTIGELCALSLRHPLVDPAFWTLDGDWTYVEEARYFAPVLPFVAVAALRIPFARPRGSRLRNLALAGIAVGVGLWRLWVWGALAVEWPERRWSNPAFRAEMKRVEALAAPFRDGSGIYVDADASRQRSARMAGSPVLARWPARAGPIRRPLTLLVALPPGRAVPDPRARREARLSDVDLWRFELPAGAPPPVLEAGPAR